MDRFRKEPNGSHIKEGEAHGTLRWAMQLESLYGNRL